MARPTRATTINTRAAGRSPALTPHPSAACTRRSAASHTCTPRAAANHTANKHQFSIQIRRRPPRPAALQIACFPSSARTASPASLTFTPPNPLQHHAPQHPSQPRLPPRAKHGRPLLPSRRIDARGGRGETGEEREMGVRPGSAAAAAAKSQEIQRCSFGRGENEGKMVRRMRGRRVVGHVRHFSAAPPSPILMEYSANLAILSHAEL